MTSSPSARSGGAPRLGGRELSDLAALSRSEEDLSQRRHARRDHEGIALKQRADSGAAAALTAWLEQLREDHSDRIIPISDRIALEWGRLAAERNHGVADGLIAATAMV